jgi:hypothetical protein
MINFALDGMDTLNGPLSNSTEEIFVPNMPKYRVIPYTRPMSRLSGRMVGILDFGEIDELMDLIKENMNLDFIMEVLEASIDRRNLRAIEMMLRNCVIKTEMLLGDIIYNKILSTVNFDLIKLFYDHGLEFDQEIPRCLFVILFRSYYKELGFSANKNQKSFTELQKIIEFFMSEGYVINDTALSLITSSYPDHNILKYLAEKCLIHIEKISTECLITKFRESFFKNVDLETIIYLLENGANIHHNNEEPLKSAIKTINFDLIKLLLEYGADPLINNYSVFNEVKYWNKYGEHKLLELFTLFQTHGCILKDIPCITKILKQVIANNYVSVIKLFSDSDVDFSKLNTETDIVKSSKYNTVRNLLRDHKVNDDIIIFLQHEYKLTENLDEFMPIEYESIEHDI